ncbi:MAG: TadE family protein [Candidatus Nanopelagicales bacterium]
MTTRFREDRGSALVDFVLVVPILLAVALAVLQVILVMHVRIVLTSAAAEGARAASLAGADPRAGQRRAQTIIDETIASGSVESITVSRETWGRTSVMALEIDARLPLLGLLGPSMLHVKGHSLQEQA